jgi:nucleotide-binding universal stress UspA family protein
MAAVRAILVPVDFSPHSLAALERARDLARASGSSLHLLHCYEIPAPGFDQYRIALPETVWERIREGAERRLEELAAEAAALGLSVTSELSADPPGQAIAAVARRIGADLVVMGTHGNTGLKHLLLGSVAERTVRTAPCSVLVAK